MIASNLELSAHFPALEMNYPQLSSHHFLLCEVEKERFSNPEISNDTQYTHED
jgi:hypothetical protein